jgi:hypothetical protein
MPITTRCLLGPALMGVLLLGTVPAAARPPSPDQATQTSPASSPSAGAEEPALGKIAQIASDALLTHLTKAQGLLYDGDVAGTRRHLVLAMRFAQAADAMMPSSSLSDLLDQAKHGLTSDRPSALNDNLPAIYGALDKLHGYAPYEADRIRRTVRQGEQLAEKDRLPEAQHTIDLAAFEAAQVAEYMPYGYVSDEIRKVQQALDQTRPDLGRAQQALVSAIRAVRQATANAPSN